MRKRGLEAVDDGTGAGLRRSPSAGVQSMATCAKLNIILTTLKAFMYLLLQIMVLILPYPSFETFGSSFISGQVDSK